MQSSIDGTRGVLTGAILPHIDGKGERRRSRREAMTYGAILSLTCAGGRILGLRETNDCSIMTLEDAC